MATWLVVLVAMQALVVLAGAGCADGTEPTTTVATASATTSVTAPIETTSTASVTAPPSDEDAIKESISQDFAAPGLEFTLTRIAVVGDWAGAIVQPLDPTMEGAAVLLRRDVEGWQVIDGGTGYTREDWMASGAPSELGDWFGD